jgi:hypothetical protein
MERAQFQNWSDSDLVEYWLERVSIRIEGTKLASESDVRQAEYLAAREIKACVAVDRLPKPIYEALRKFK